MENAFRFDPDQESDHFCIHRDRHGQINLCRIRIHNPEFRCKLQPDRFKIRAGCVNGAFADRQLGRQSRCGRIILIRSSGRRRLGRRFGRLLFAAFRARRSR